MGYSMINNTTLNKWELNFNPTNSGTRTVTLNTAGTFLDRNIDIVVTIPSTSRTAGSGDITLTKTSGNVVLTAGSGDSGNSTNPSISLATSTPSSGVYYTLTATGSGVISGTGKGNVSTGSGWVTSGNTWSDTATDSLSYSDTTQGYIIKSIHGSAVSGSVPTVPSGAIGIEIQPKGYIIIPAGYNPQDRYVYANVADESSESRAASEFSLSISSVSANSNVSVGILNNDKYPIIANNLSITGTLTANTTGWFSAGSATANDTDNVTVGTMDAAVSDISFAYGTTPTISGTKKPVIFKQNTPSGVTNAANGDAINTTPSSGVYVAIKTAEDTATLTVKENITTAGFVPAGEFNNETILVGATASDMTYIPIKTTSLSFAGGALNNKAATATFVNANNKVISAASTDSYNNGLSVQAKGTAGRAAVTYTNNAGWLDANNSTSASEAVTTSTWNGTTYYLTGVKIASPSSGIAKFDITVPNGNTTDFITFQFQVDSSGNVYVMGPDDEQR